MKLNSTSTAYFIAGALFFIAAVCYFFNKQIIFGFTYVCLSIVFTSLGVNYRKGKIGK